MSSVVTSSTGQIQTYTTLSTTLIDLNSGEDVSKLSIGAQADVPKTENIHLICQRIFKCYLSKHFLFSICYFCHIIAVQCIRDINIKHIIVQCVRERDRRTLHLSNICTFLWRIFFFCFWLFACAVFDICHPVLCEITSQKYKSKVTKIEWTVLHESAESYALHAAQDVMMATHRRSLHSAERVCVWCVWGSAIQIDNIFLHGIVHLSPHC